MYSRNVSLGAVSQDDHLIFSGVSGEQQAHAVT